MQDLTPVGLSEDGSTLVLVSSSGEEFAVRVDTRLRAALRGENARLGQLEMKMDSALRPRDIQARIRAGESPEDVADAAKTTVEAIMPYAGPVLAERAHVAQTALKASLRRRSGETTSQARTLGEATEQHLAEHSLHDEDVEWDSWRRPDGRWALVASYTVSGSARTAEFTHDLPGRYVVAENDHARVLTGELPAPGPAPAAGTRAAQVRRLSSVPTQDELPLGDDAIELVRDRPQGAEEPTTEVRVEPAPSPDPLAETADADWIATPTPAPDDVPLPVAETETETESDPASDADQPAVPEDETPSPAPRKKGRSSVPSWDEIMFGGGKGD